MPTCSIISLSLRTGWVPARSAIAQWNSSTRGWKHRAYISPSFTYSMLLLLSRLMVNGGNRFDYVDHCHSQELHFRILQDWASWKVIEPLCASDQTQTKKIKWILGGNAEAGKCLGWIYFLYHLSFLSATSPVCIGLRASRMTLCSICPTRYMFHDGRGENQCCSSSAAEDACTSQILAYTGCKGSPIVGILINRW